LKFQVLAFQCSLFCFDLNQLGPDVLDAIALVLNDIALLYDGFFQVGDKMYERPEVCSAAIWCGVFMLA